MVEVLAQAFGFVALAFPAPPSLAPSQGQKAHLASTEGHHGAHGVCHKGIHTMGAHRSDIEEMLVTGATIAPHKKNDNRSSLLEVGA